jgi:hypothetical protein
MSSRANVVVGTPCYGGLVTHVYLHSLMKLMAFAMAREIGMMLWTAAHDSLVPRSRNAIVAGFLDNAAATHLMFIDADTGFEPEQFWRLLTFDEDVVAGMYPVKNLDWSQSARRCSEGGLTVEQLRESGLHYVGVPCSGADEERRGGFAAAHYAGTGFMLIRRAVVERMIAAHPELQYRTTQTYPAPARPSNNQYNFFDPAIEPETRTYLSEDFAFCRRWRKLGGKIWLDTQSRLRHVGSYEFQGSPLVELAK